jgi:hypothetical protein
VGNPTLSCSGSQVSYAEALKGTAALSIQEGAIMKANVTFEFDSKDLVIGEFDKSQDVVLEYFPDNDSEHVVRLLYGKVSYIKFFANNAVPDPGPDPVPVMPPEHDPDNPDNYVAAVDHESEPVHPERDVIIQNEHLTRISVSMTDQRSILMTIASLQSGTNRALNVIRRIMWCIGLSALGLFLLDIILDHSPLFN